MYLYTVLRPTLAYCKLMYPVIGLCAYAFTLTVANTKKNYYLVNKGIIQV